jgi:hypothetical protein
MPPGSIGETATKLPSQPKLDYQTCCRLGFDSVNVVKRRCFREVTNFNRLNVQRWHVIVGTPPSHITYRDPRSLVQGNTRRPNS